MSQNRLVNNNKMVILTQLKKILGGMYSLDQTTLITALKTIEHHHQEIKTSNNSRQDSSRMLNWMQDQEILTFALAVKKNGPPQSFKQTEDVKDFQTILTNLVNEFRHANEPVESTQTVSNIEQRMNDSINQLSDHALKLNVKMRITKLIFSTFDDFLKEKKSLFVFNEHDKKTFFEIHHLGNILSDAMDYQHAFKAISTSIKKNRNDTKFCQLIEEYLSHLEENISNTDLLKSFTQSTTLIFRHIPPESLNVTKSAPAILMDNRSDITVTAIFDSYYEGMRPDVLDSFGPIKIKEPDDLDEWEELNSSSIKKSY